MELRAAALFGAVTNSARLPRSFGVVGCGLRFARCRQKEALPRSSGWWASVFASLAVTKKSAAPQPFFLVTPTGIEPVFQP